MRRPVPVLLAVLLGAAVVTTAAAGTASGWRDRVHADDRLRIERAIDQAAGIRPEGGAYADDLAIARALLKRAERPKALGDVTGRWRVRSIQVNPYGTFAYPYFAAAISRQAGGLRFAKTTGSQRRTGVLLPGGDGRSLVFLGGATVNDEAPVAYSRIADPRAAPRDSDSVGRLVRLGARELLIVLDPSPDRYELYHLVR